MDTIGVYRTGSFLLRNSNSPGSADLTFSFGTAGDTPLAGDWDGLNKQDTLLISQHYEKELVSGAETKRCYAGTRLLATRTRRQFPLTDTLSFIQPDHLGSTSHVADSSGTLQVRERYAAFGERRLGEDPKTTEYLYTGQRQHSLFGLYHYSDGRSAGRFYDPLLARFVQPDPIRLDTGSQALNPFSYAESEYLAEVEAREKEELLA